MTFSDFAALKSPTGATLAVRHQPAEGEARGVVHINHGLAEHAARYATFAGELAAAGYHVYAHDHRGHGRTEAPDAPPRVFATGGNGAETVIADISGVHDHIRAIHADLPLVIFGHSMGGLIAMNYALRHPEGLSAAAVWNANFSGGAAGRAALAMLAWEKMRLGSDAVSRALPKLTFGQWAGSVKDRRTDFDWLSQDPAVVDAYIADPDCGWDASVSMWRDVFSLVFSGSDVSGASPAARALPFHLVGGGQDPATAGGKAVRAQADRLQKAGFSDVTLRIYDDFRHETLNETARETAVADFMAWLDEKTAPPA